MGQGLITMPYMFISSVYFVVSCGIIIDYLYSKKVQKIGIHHKLRYDGEKAV